MALLAALAAPVAPLTPPATPDAAATPDAPPPAAQMGFKWRRIAAMLPNRSDDAVRNRWHRLEEARRHNDATGVANDAGYERSSVYKCSRCGQPKKHHICLAPEETSRSEEIKAKKSAGKDTQRLTW